MCRFPQVIEYSENDDKFRAEQMCDNMYNVYVWSKNDSVGPFVKGQEVELGWWVMYYHNDYEGIMETINKEKTKMKQLKPFNLEQALAGAPVVTRNGLPIVEMQYLQTTSNLAVVRKEDDEKLISYFVPCSGKLSNTRDYATDLFMAPTKKEGWINVYNVLSLDVTGKNIYPTEEAALANKGCDCIATIKIEWEE
jgi:hypothetical protein